MDSIHQDCRQYLTGTAWRQVIFNYIPHQLLKDVDTTKIGLNNSEILHDSGEGLVQKLLENSNFKLRMYGSSAGELAYYLQRYKDFTSSHRVFRMNIIEPYNNLIDILCYFNDDYEKARDDFFIVKQDIFVMLQSMIFSNFPEMKILPRSILMILLKTQEAQLSKCHEYVKYVEREFEKIEKFITSTMRTTVTSGSAHLQYQLSSRFTSFDEIVSKWREMVPEFSNEQFEPIRRALLDHLEQFPVEVFPEMYSEVYYCSKVLIEMLQKVFSDRKELFWPNEQVKSKTAPIVVRVFHDIEDRFVFISELYNALNRLKPDEKPIEYSDPEPFLLAMELKEMVKTWEIEKNRFDMVLIPINRLKKSSPIMTPNGDYCMLAMDAFVEIMGRVIEARKLFQKIKKQSDLEEFMKILRPFFNENQKSRYFIKLSAIQSIEQQLDDFSKKFQSIPAKDVRNAKKDGFTLQNLKNELKNLEVTDVFSDTVLMDFVPTIYENLLRAKGGEVLTTQDLFDKVQECQFVAFLQMFPELYRFMHTQKIDHAPCELCSQEQRLGMAMNKDGWETRNGVTSKRAPGPVLFIK